MKKLVVFVQTAACTALILSLCGLTAAAEAASEISVTAEKSVLPSVLAILGGVLLFIIAGISAYKMISKRKK